MADGEQNLELNLESALVVQDDGSRPNMRRLSEHSSLQVNSESDPDFEPVCSGMSRLRFVI